MLASKKIVSFFFLLAFVSCVNANESNNNLQAYFEEVTASLDSALEQEEAKKSQTNSAFLSNAAFVKQNIKEKIEVLERAAQDLQKNYLEEINQLEQKYNVEKSTAEKKFLNALQDVHAQIKNLIKQNK